jgi:hypothetical protein
MTAIILPKQLFYENWLQKLIAPLSAAFSFRRLISVFPFGKPVSSASPFTLEFRHSAAALWTDQVND